MNLIPLVLLILLAASLAVVLVIREGTRDLGYAVGRVVGMLLVVLILIIFGRI